MKKHFDTKIKIFEPFAHFLKGSESEYEFEITLLDIVRFSGHACPSVIGAFYISREVIKEFYPDDHKLVRGDIKIYHKNKLRDAAVGPISNVFGYIFGAWAVSGFRGLQGYYNRDELQIFESSLAHSCHYVFEHLPTQRKIGINYKPSNVMVTLTQFENFQDKWRFFLNHFEQNIDQMIFKESFK